MTDLAIRNVQRARRQRRCRVRGRRRDRRRTHHAVGAHGAATREIDGTGSSVSRRASSTRTRTTTARSSATPAWNSSSRRASTTVVSGNCGFSAIPADPHADAVAASGGILAGVAGEFTDLSRLLQGGARAQAGDQQPDAGRPQHRAHDGDGHGAARARRASELATMRGHVERAMEQGACGFSTGLIYRPGRWSGTEEVIELAKAAQPFDGLYTTHMRNEGDRLLEAVEESLRIGVESRRARAHLASQERRQAELGQGEGLARARRRGDWRVVSGDARRVSVHGRQRSHDRVLQPRADRPHAGRGDPHRELSGVSRTTKAACSSTSQRSAASISPNSCETDADGTARRSDDLHPLHHRRSRHRNESASCRHDGRARTAFRICAAARIRVCSAPFRACWRATCANAVCSGWRKRCGA